ncbi:MAG TPA: YebC/PmpR family DNA-binding transcriptional regulator [Caldilineaceae bacterium]|nr:YebC/PmpR family DNA-binding transcriptional regulator [Caldilineaceae bacterium]
MSGHSKWSTIKRKKGAADNARGKVFTKLAREIQVAARAGADPTMNFALRLAVDKAKAANMPKDNIERSIRRGAGLEKDSAIFEEVMYEGYGPNGVAVLVECITDNRTRTVADLRRLFTRSNGSLGEPGSVAWQFTQKGYILFNRLTEDGEEIAIDPDVVFEVALEAGAEDVVISDDVVEVYTDRTSFAGVSQALQENNLTPAESSLVMKPNMTVELDSEEAASVLTLVENLEDCDDVSRVFHNLELTDAVVAQFA